MIKSKVKINDALMTDFKEYNRVMRTYGSKEMSLEQYVKYRQGRLRTKKRAVKGPMHATTLVRETVKVTSNSEVAYAPSYKEPQVYTGTLIKGVSVLHKSNGVPVTNNEDILEISKMRRQ